MSAPQIPAELVAAIKPGVLLVGVAANSAGHQFENDERTSVVVVNVGASRVMTIPRVKTRDGIFLEEPLVVTCAAGLTIIPFLKRSEFGETVTFSFDATTSLTIYYAQLPVAA
jgi:hypothetical protein